MAVAQRGRLADLGGQFGGTDQRLGGHAAGVQAIAAHGVFLYQADVGLDRCGNVGANEAAAAGTNYHQIAVELFGPLPAFVDSTGLDHVQQAPGNQGEQPQQHEGAEQPRREDAGQRVQLTEFAAGVHIHQRARQHAELADPPEGARRQAGQAHCQIDQKERKRRHQPQGKQVERAFAVDALIDAFQS